MKKLETNTNKTEVDTLTIPLTAKFTTKQFEYIGVAAKIEGEDKSTFVRNSTLIRADNVQRSSSNIEEQNLTPGRMKLEELTFIKQAYEKFMIANNIEIPTLEELLKLWVEGKKETAVFGRVRVLVVPEVLPQYMLAPKSLDPK